MPGSAWSCSTASTRRARRAGRSREASGGSPRRPSTSSGGRWTGSARGSTRRTQTLGVAPHSIRAASPDEIREIHREAARRGLPVHLHVEEQRREIEESLAAYGADADGGRSSTRSRTAPFTAVHCTHTADADMERFLAARRHGLPLPAHRGQPGRRHPAARAGARLGRPPRHRHRQQQPARDARGDALAGVRPAAARRAARRAARCQGRRRAHAARRRDGRRRRRAGRAAPAGSRPGSWADFVAIDLGAPALAEVPAERLLAALVFGAGNEAIAGTYVGGRWRASGEPTDGRLRRLASSSRAACPSCPTSPSTSTAWPRGPRPAARAPRRRGTRSCSARSARRRRRSRAAGSTGLRRMGKRIVLALEGERFLVIHLMIAGRLRWLAAGGKPPGKIALALFDFPRGTLVLTEAGTKRRASIHLVDGRGRARSRSSAAGWRCSRPTRDAFAARLVQREPHAQARAHRPAALQRHRQRLLRRDPPPRAALAAGAHPEARRRGRSSGCIDATRDDARGLDRPAARRGRATAFPRR